MPPKIQPISILYRWLPPAAGLVVIIVGSISILGWIMDTRALLDGANIDITIKFNTAVCTTLAAMALFVSAVRPTQKVAVRLLAGTSALIAGATLLQHLTGANFGIDTLIVDDIPNAAATTSPGRMGMPASVSLTSLGLALVFSTFRATRRPAAMLATACLCIAGLSLTGYLFGADQLYALPAYTGIALRTAAMISILALGLGALVREHGMFATLGKDDAGGKMFRRLVVPVIATSIILGSIRLWAQAAGYVDATFGTAARTLAEVVLLVWLLWWTAESLSRSEARLRDTMRVREENETLHRIAVAQEAERRRIARDVHDHIGQSLTALRLNLESMQERGGGNGEFVREISRTCEQAKKLDADMSLLVWQMRPGVLDTHGLASAVNSFIREWSLNHGIDAEFQASSSERRLLPEIETNLYRIIQEALNNIVKHAKATKVSITINYLTDEAVLVIEDDGLGFDTEADAIHTTEGSGFGLIGMKERALLVGGRLEIESTPGSGTAILVRVPRTASRRAMTANGSGE